MNGFKLSVIVRNRGGGRWLPDSTGSPINCLLSQSNGPSSCRRHCARRQRRCLLWSFGENKMRAISIELVPRSVAALEEECLAIKARFPRLEVANIPDILRMPLRSWETAATVCAAICGSTSSTRMATSKCNAWSASSPRGPRIRRTACQDAQARGQAEERTLAQASMHLCEPR